MVDIGVQFFELFFGVILKDSGVIDTLFNTILNLLQKGAGFPQATVDRLTKREQKESGSNVLIVGILQTDKVRRRTNQSLLDVGSRDAVIEREV